MANKKKQKEKQNYTGEIVSAIAGGAFFAIPFLGLSVPLIPSLLIGGGAFLAGELVFHKEEAKEIATGETPLYKRIDMAREQTRKIKNYVEQIDDADVRLNINSIYDSSTKIINAIEKEPNKVRKVNNFFDYYLPITLTMVARYDEIENQGLSTADVKKFQDKTSKMLSRISTSFRNMLNNLYQDDMIDTDAEMRVFDAMLKSDGFNEKEIVVKDKEE
jgi:5-bromo-4-chloroindolyl phosphate hydrolysis protein